MVQFLDHLDQTNEATDEIKISSGIRSEIDALKKDTAADLATDLKAVHTAFAVSQSYDADRKPWNTYFQPMGSGTTADGTSAYFPDIPTMPTAFFDEWINAADTRTHPIIRARFNDLVWDFWPYFRKEKRNVEYAVRAIDAYNPLFTPAAVCFWERFFIHPTLHPSPERTTQGRGCW